MEDQDKVIVEIDDDEFEPEEEAKKTVRVLSFGLGAESYCVGITDAKEVFKPLSVTRVPNTPAFVIGVTNLHGEIVPIIDIRYFLGLEQKEGLEGTKAISTDVKGSPIAILVDSIGEARNIEEEAIQPPIATIKGRLADFTIGEIEIGKEMLIMIDLKKILNCEEIINLNKGQ